jgi:acyl-coenzyme A synthetase/AMP-(fatty) acid ligase
VRRKLAAYCVPKRWLAVARLPLDEKGKLDHAALAACLRG